MHIGRHARHGDIPCKGNTLVSPTEDSFEVSNGRCHSHFLSCERALAKLFNQVIVTVRV
jgi:hypothetical protein